MVGCCGVTPPPAEKFFDRATPLETFKGFVYAVDTHQWDYAYNCLSAASKAEIGPTKFEIAIRWLNDPVYHKVPVYDIISNSVTAVVKVEQGPRSARIQVLPNVRDADGILNAFDTSLIFVEEDNGLWFFDFFKTIDAILQGPPRPPPTDVSSRDTPRGH